METVESHKRIAWLESSVDRKQPDGIYADKVYRTIVIRSNLFQKNAILHFEGQTKCPSLALLSFCYNPSIMIASLSDGPWPFSENHVCEYHKASFVLFPMSLGIHEVNKSKKPKSHAIEVPRSPHHYSSLAKQNSLISIETWQI